PGLASARRPDVPDRSLLDRRLSARVPPAQRGGRHRGERLSFPHAPARPVLRLAAAGRAARTSRSARRWAGSPRHLAGDARGYAARRSAAMSATKITLIGGPTALIEVGGFRLLTDPTFDEAGEYRLPHTTLKKTSRPALTAEQIGPV